jgi:DNA invertase Pin-like site-specific DNA recombinase
MAYVRKYQQQEFEVFSSAALAATPLPTERPIANYYRQSTAEQVGNISTTMQHVDMPAYLQRLGWQRDNIVMIDMDEGVSGTTKIDEREGMKRLFGLITRQEIGAVACQDEDRLFRDVTQIQVNIFMDACKSARVLLITPAMIYDFAHPSYGAYHARQFRFKSEMAADYIETVVLGKLYTAKRNMYLAGQWAAGAMPVGYIVDMRKRLPDGNVNEHWRRYEIGENGWCITSSTSLM